MNKWTKGPWSIDKRASTRVVDDADTTIASAGLASRILEDAQANAQLISAAPELYEALKACHLQMLQSNNATEYAEEANQMAIAALAKARGER